MNVKDDKMQPVIISDVCETATEVPLAITEVSQPGEPDSLLVVKTKKKREGDNRKRSWVWKYFDKLSNIIFRCNLCNVVLSIKGCNSNNMNRHVRTKHPTIYHSEVVMIRKNSDSILDVGSEVESPYIIKSNLMSDVELDEDPVQKQSRRSWVWAFFKRITDTQAECMICKRKINHGGNATGNMNRHVKMIHPTVFQNFMKQEKNKILEDSSWVWKVFDNDERDFYTCKICQYRCFKFTELEKSVNCIVQHLKNEHGVISGDQIITGNEFEEN